MTRLGPRLRELQSSEEERVVESCREFVVSRHGSFVD